MLNLNTTEVCPIGKSFLRLKSISLLVGLFIITGHALAQDADQTMVNISYFGNTITHPGFKLGLERPLSIKDKEKTRKSGKVIPKRRSFFVTGNFSTTYHRRYNTSLLLNSEIGYRRIRKNGFKVEALLGIGLIRTFVNGDTYRVNDSGDVSRVRFAGQWGFAPSLAFGFGKDFGFKEDKPWAYHIKPTVYLQTPYNHTFLVHFALEAGVTYKLSNLFKK